MLNLIKRNKIYFENLSYENINLKKKNQIINAIKTKKIIYIEWSSNSNKTNLISYIIKNSTLVNKYLYLNKNFDLDNILKNNNSLEFLLRHLEDYENKPKIIILENISEIPNIEKFILYLEKNNYKLIIISDKNRFNNLWIDIEIIKIPENRKYIFKQIAENTKKELQKLDTKNTIIEKVIKPNNIKNIDLYNYTLIFLSKLNLFSSIREINRKLNKVIKISLITMMEYLKYSEESKIIKQVKVFDFKKKKVIETKTKYFFTDTDFRNSLYNFEINENILKQNFLYNELIKSWYKIYSWINWSYEFDFYGNKTLTQSLPWEKKLITIYIDFCKKNDKKEIKKQINKLIKVPEIIDPINSKENITHTFSKYLVLENPSELWIKKLQYENLKIISLDELLKLI